MKIHSYIRIWSAVLFLSGGLMAEQTEFPLFQDWITIKDEQAGLQIDFPDLPLKMTFDVPFQNIPPKGEVLFYSTPTKAGLLVLSTFHSSTVNSEWLHKEKLHDFFETVLAPHFFFNPTLFQNRQTFHFQKGRFNKQKSAFFEFSFQDHDMVKKLEGIALIRDQVLYLFFYLASEKDFNQDILHHFLRSIQFSESNQTF